MKNKKIMLLLLVMMLCIPFSVKADDTIEKFPIRVSGTGCGSDGCTITKKYYEDNNGPKYGASETQFIAINSNSGYCIDWSIPLGGGVGLGSAQTFWHGLTEYPPAKMKYSKEFSDYLSSEMNITSGIDSLIQKINLIYYYGYHADISSRTIDSFTHDELVKYLATQALIWENISAKGGYHDLTADQLLDIYTEEEAATVVTRTPDVGTYSFGTLSNITFVRKDTPHNDVVPESEVVTAKNTILGSVTDYSTLPSFCPSNDVITIVKGDKHDFTDSNNVLSRYSVVASTCPSDKLDCVISGNKLTITAKDIVDSTTIKIKRSVNSSAPATAMVYRYLDNKATQGVLVPGKPSSMECTVTVKVVEPEPEPGCYVCDSGYVWSDDGEPENETHCELQPSVQSEANCKADLKCYKCKTDDKKFEYKWGELGKDDITEDKCTEQAEIDDATACKPACYLCGTDYIWSENAEEDDIAFKECKVQPKITEEENCKYVPPVVPKTSKPSISNPQTSGLRIAYVSLLCGIVAAVGFVYFYSKKPDNE